MKVLLSVPLRIFRHSHPTLPDLGLGYLAASVRKAGHDVRILDWNDRSSADELTGFLRDFEPDLIGLKFFTLNVASASRTLQFFRSLLGEDPIIILGGPHPCAEEGQWLVHDFPEADARFLGEAEETLVHFLSLLNADHYDRHRLPLPACQGFEPFVNSGPVAPPPVFVENLDSLPGPAWDLIDPRRYPAFAIDGVKRILAPLMTSRGCPQGCSFCCIEHISGKRVRRHSVQAVIDQMAYLHKHYDVSAFTFLDTNFMTDLQWLSEFCDAAEQFAGEIVWNCVWGLGADRYDRHLLKAMKDVGCHAIIMGIESGHDLIRKAMGKPESVAEVREHVVKIHQTGIGVHGFFMLGFPEEDESHMKSTIDLAFTLPLEMLSVSMLFPLPGSNFYTFLKARYGIERIDWKTFDVKTTPLSMSRLSSSQVASLKRKAQLRNMMRPSRLLADIRRGLFSKDVLMSKLKSFLHQG